MPSKISKAFLLAAGLGTRLRPLTDRIPKCLVPIDGRPLLRIWLDICDALGIQEVLINTHHLPGTVRTWAQQQTSRVKIRLFHEDVLLGSAGTVRANREFVGNDENFYIFYADNLVYADLQALEYFHFQHSGVLTLGLFRTSTPSACGIVNLDRRGWITGFEEKPSLPKSNLANAGLYVARRSLFDWLPPSGFADFGKDIFPTLAGRMWGMPLGGYVRDIGTPENYQKALEEWPKISRRVARRVLDSSPRAAAASPE